MWVAAPALGFFRELAWPTGYAWTDYYIMLLGVVVGLLEIALQLFNMAFGPLQGYLYDNTVIESVFYTTVGYGCLQCVLSYVMTYYANRKGSRKAREVKATQSALALCVSDNTKL